jgi:hypothetical protein
MNKRTAIELFAKKMNAATYMEIGIAAGKTITRVSIPQRIGVDPSPKLPLNVKIARLFKKNYFKIFRMTSDHFFERKASNVLEKGVDVVLIDGLHTYQQALRDVMNSLKYLNSQGVILMHDCSPKSRLHAYPVQKSIQERHAESKRTPELNWPKGWNGDVWKAVWHLRCTEPQLTIFTLDCDHGVGVILKQTVKAEKLDSDIADVAMIGHSDYSFLEANRQRILNLKEPDYLYEVLKNLPNGETGK